MVDCYQPLTDSQWQVIAALLPVQRKRRHCLRLIVDSLRYSYRTGCHWSCLPACFPPRSAVYYYFRRWQLTGLWQTLADAVNQADRVAAGRPATPSLVCLDSQSVRLAPRIFEHRGLHGGKHVNGRKRQILTDVQGRMMACRVHATNGHDGVEALLLLPTRPAWGARLVTVVTDKRYRGRFARHVVKLGLLHQIGSRPPSTRGSVPVANRWVVEHTFAWLTSFRRLAIDYEFTPRSHEIWLFFANIYIN
ncbi:IS5 family transposase [Hymenobacter psoromatis]|uniref:IS5 family transposase n=1 Tax=Hymenobacter psoromatis TaxID=1484116 RepID=UPI001CBC7E09|nr:IS5 family transposase [Hymenobacter psoromatis]